MKEAQKFFRYLTPGLVLIIEVSIYLSISNWTATKEIFEGISQQKTMSLVGIFLASGGVGYFLSFIYHTISDGTCCFDCIKIDYRRLIINAVTRKWLGLHRRNSGTIITAKDLKTQLTINGAHMIKSGILYERKPSSARIEDISKRMDNFYNILHGLGATLIGSIIAAPIWLSLARYYNSPHVIPRLVVSAVLMNLGIIILHAVSYNRTARKTQSLVEIALSKELNEASDDGHYPFSLDVSENDINLQWCELIDVLKPLKWLCKRVRRMICCPRPKIKREGIK